MVVRFNWRRLATRAAFFLFCCCAVPAQDEELADQSRQAKQLMAEGRFAEAVPIYQKLVRALPGNIGLVLNLGLAQEMAGRPAEAVPQFEAVLKHDPSNIPALTSLATARLQMNQPKLAIAPLEKLITAEPANRDARGMLAGALAATGRWPEAAEHYRRLTASDASDAKAWFGLGKAYEALAQQSFNRLETIAPESAWVLALVGDAQASTGQYRSAFFFYKKAEQKNPHLPGLHAGLAGVYEKSGHPDWAGDERRREQARPQPDCMAHRAECDMTAGRILAAATAQGSAENLFWAARAYNVLAARAFEQLGNLPESVEIHALKANILTGRRQYQEAVGEWRAAAKLAPSGDPPLRHELAVALFLAKDYGALVPMLESELAAGNPAADVHFMLGDSYLRTEQPDKAIPELQAALKAQPDMEAAHASLGLALAQTGKPAEAIPHLTKALHLDDDGSLHYQLARAYQAQGDAARAKECMAGYQKIQAENRQHKEEVAREAQITPPGS